MGFVGELMRGEYGVEWYYIVGLLIFIILFIVILYRTFRLTKPELISYKQSILEEEDIKTENNSQNRNLHDMEDEIKNSELEQQDTDIEESGDSHEYDGDKGVK